MGQHPVSIVKEGKAVFGYFAAHFHILAVYGKALPLQSRKHRLHRHIPVILGGVQHAVQRPAEVYRRRAGAVEIAAVLHPVVVEIVEGIVGGLKGQAVGAVARAYAYCRSAAHAEHGYRLEHLLSCGKRYVFQPVGQQRLIDYHHRAPVVGKLYVICMSDFFQRGIHGRGSFRVFIQIIIPTSAKHCQQAVKLGKTA